MKDLILNNKRSDLDCIAAPVKACMARFESDFAAALGVSEMPMQVIVDFLLDTPGKRFRPLLVFLVASLCGEVNGQTRRVASFVEMLHTATLLHDDVVDGDLERRGKPSVNARWDNLSAVLAGDYLLARALLLLSDPQDAAILSEMLQTSLTMSVGELVQHQRRKECLAKEPVEVPSRENIVSESLPEEAYLDIITHKTARLYARVAWLRPYRWAPLKSLWKVWAVSVSFWDKCSKCATTSSTRMTPKPPLVPKSCCPNTRALPWKHWIPCRPWHSIPNVLLHYAASLPSAPPGPCNISAHRSIISLASSIPS